MKLIKAILSAFILATAFAAPAQALCDFQQQADNPGGGATADPSLAVYLEGSVVDQNNAPLQGVQIALIGLGQSALTDSEGTYSIRLNDPAAESTVIQVTAPSWGPNYSQEYLPQSQFVDIRAIPILSTKPYFDEVAPNLHHVDDLREPKRVSYHAFRLQSRGSWTSTPIGPNGGTAESANHEFKVSVPAGVFAAEYRVVITKVPIIDHSFFSSINGKDIDAVTALEFEVVLVDDNNQIVAPFSFAQSVTLEFSLPEWELLPEYPGAFRPLGKAYLMDFQGLRLNLEPAVINGWNAADKRYSFSLPHFSQWKIKHTGDDATLWRDARIERKAVPPKKLHKPNYKVVSTEEWETLATIDVICGAPVGTFQYTEAAGSAVSNAFSVVASADIKPFLPVLTAKVDASFSHSGGATKNQEITIHAPPVGQQYDAHWTGQIVVKVLRKKAHLTSDGVVVMGTEISNIVTWKLVGEKTGGEDC